MTRLVSAQRFNFWGHLHIIPTWLLCLTMVVGILWLTGAAAPTAAAPSLTVTLLAQGDATFYEPLDATPDPTGAIVYFVARAANGQAGVFRVPATGGTVDSLLVGSPLVAPRGLVTSTDGQTLYVADPEAAQGGAVWAIPAAGGSASLVPGTQGLQPRALDLVRDGQGDVLYIAGSHPTNHRAAVWRIALGTNKPPTSVMSGSPLATVDGLAVAASGTIYVAGRTGRAATTDTVLQIDGRGHRPLVRSVRLGNPAGLALTPDSSQLLISSLASNGTSQVLIVDLATNSQTTFNDVIGANRGSGGLHRAHLAHLYAWAGVGRQGGVYVVRP